MADEFSPPASRRAKRSKRRVRQRDPARECKLTVRLSTTEYDRLKAKAALVGKPPAVFLREHFDEVQVRHREDEHQRNVLLNRWNGNINVIAKWVNTYRYYAEARDIMGQLKAIERELALIRDLWSES
jgi:predicted DNA-binding protein